MLKARSGNLVLLGINDENVQRLQQGEPVHVKGEQLGLDQDIVIAYHEDLNALASEFTDLMTKPLDTVKQ